MFHQPLREQGHRHRQELVLNQKQKRRQTPHLQEREHRHEQELTAELVPDQLRYRFQYLNQEHNGR